MVEPLPTSLQQSILTTLLVNNKNGALIAAQVKPESFDDGLYREVATTILDYRRRYNRAPGWNHTDDLFAVQLSSGHKRAPLMRRLLGDLLALSDGLNSEYIASQTQKFLRDQAVKSMMTDMTDRFGRGGPEATEDILSIIRKGLKVETPQLDAGTFLNNPERALSFLDQSEQSLPLGIPILDALNVGPTPKEMLLYIGPKGSGKSFFCVHVGRQGLIHKERVCHISLEFSEVKVVGRYFQSLFAGGYEPTVQLSELEIDELGRVTGFNPRRQKVEIDFSAPDAKKQLMQRVNEWGARIGRLVVKQFPTASLSIQQLEAYLDYLESSHKFIPTVLIVDYPDLMKVDSGNYRHSLGRIFEELRGVGVRRNMSIVAPTQSAKIGIGARQVKATMVAEDIRKVNTADNVLTYSQTPAEAERGLARLTVAFARNAPSGLQVLISQAYGMGQYVLQSARVTNAYWEQMKALTGQGAEADE